MHETRTRELAVVLGAAAHAGRMKPRQGRGARPRTEPDDLDLDVRPLRRRPPFISSENEIERTRRRLDRRQPEVVHPDFQADETEVADTDRLSRRRPLVRPTLHRQGEHRRTGRPHLGRRDVRREDHERETDRDMTERQSRWPFLP